jgi:hypothetical protein
MFLKKFSLLRITLLIINETPLTMRQEIINVFHDRSAINPRTEITATPKRSGKGIGAKPQTSTFF